MDRVYLLDVQYARHEKPLGVKPKNVSLVGVLLCSRPFQKKVVYTKRYFPRNKKMHEARRACEKRSLLSSASRREGFTSSTPTFFLTRVQPPTCSAKERRSSRICRISGRGAVTEMECAAGVYRASTVTVLFFSSGKWGDHRCRCNKT
jgi:hypothetical protein